MNFLEENVDITNLSNFKTPAKARYYFEIKERQDVDNLGEIYAFAKKENKKLLFVGGGTNLLFGFDIFDGIIIKNKLKGWNYDNKTEILESYSNELISNIAQILEIDDNMQLWHRFIGLPGSIGGAIFGNAGCFGLEIENNFLSADIFDMEEGVMKTFFKDDMEFSYRNSILKEESPRYFLVNCKFDLSEKREKYHSNVDNIYFRENKQPKGNNCGSFFKNPKIDLEEFFSTHSELERGELKGLSAGYLIEQSGLKGYSVGGAFLSKQHANFLMSDGETCSYQDLLDLIEFAQKEVKEKFNIELENEVRIITN